MWSSDSGELRIEEYVEDSIESCKCSECYDRRWSVVGRFACFLGPMDGRRQTAAKTRRTVSDSLSIVLVANNCETSLTPDVFDLLEITGDLSSFVEILIIDDGSIDETRSVAQDLARRFPQVYVHHNAMRYGNAAAMQTAMRETIGEYVFFCTEMPSVSQLQQLWSISQEPSIRDGATVARTGRRRPCD